MLVKTKVARDMNRIMSSSMGMMMAMMTDMTGGTLFCAVPAANRFSMSTNLSLRLNLGRDIIMILCHEHEHEHEREPGTSSTEDPPEVDARGQTSSPRKGAPASMAGVTLIQLGYVGEDGDTDPPRPERRNLTPSHQKALMALSLVHEADSAKIVPSLLRPPGPFVRPSLSTHYGSPRAG